MVLTLINQIQSVITMGNTKSEHQAEHVFQSIQKEYDEIRQDSKGMILVNKQSQNTYLLKEFTFGNELMFKNKERTLRDQVQQGFKEYVITPVRVQSKVFSSFCSTSYKVYAIFEYPQVTLREEIMARQKENKCFQEAQLWSILQSCTNALSQLKPIVSLNPQEIFINPEGHIKIIHDDLIDEEYRIVLNHTMNYAPQKLKNFNRIDTELSLRKESIFSMGMTILEAAQLSDVSSCYNYKDCYFSETMMFDMIDFLAQRYSAQFIQILGNILEPNPNRRASLMEVQKVLDNFWNSEEESMEQNFEQSKGITQLAQNGGESFLQQLPLTEKSMNQQLQDPIKESARKSMTKPQRQTKVNLKAQVYTLGEPLMMAPEDLAPITPKNPPTVNENCLYTDPKLLDMIRKDLQDINKLKHSAFYETSKYTFMYPKTESILNSIKNFQSESKPRNEIIGQFNSVNQTVALEAEQRLSVPRSIDPSVMKKKNNELVYTVQAFEDGRSYEGTMFQGKKQGKGKLLFEDGAYYEGQFDNDKMNGQGILYYRQNCPAYDGQWCNDQFHGRGILYNEHPQNIESSYNYQQLFDVEQYWTRYEGQFSMDNKHGRGVLFLTNGETFEGQFRDDSISGRGVYTCMSGKRVEGEWDTNVLERVISES